ncbi:Uncharacterised protein [Chryseobacterium gleum]|uniref:Uncharacterized protein n=2 Tax=Chryseobacterium gleum TaxID=250 RepID=A0A448B7X4_CHRGE|nr:hypothetical protein [Chryseobacterium gleum]EFK36885.1 hypothetical protein HMPREF0204_11442 [Chryseobacterium gleum ATCC 35910]QQY32130.1 hypothetical protein I6I60_25420 [Chryseobacterium gleum]VEE10642.1 Uncharacterised protein [Chryseobacterium gleum]
MQNFNSFISIIDNDNDDQIEDYKKILLNNPNNFFTELSHFVVDNSKEYDRLQYIVDLYNIFDSSQKELDIVKKVGNLILSLYLEIIDDLIKNKEEYSIYSYIDFLYTNNFFLKKHEQLFFEKSFNVLSSNLNKEESSWFIISCYRLVDLYFQFDKDNFYIEKYLDVGDNELIKKYIRLKIH